ncbi:amidohydrolase [Brevibacterium sp. 50QC2O2]|uniref:amidohydrolase family protein n=1 Tax=Brevibacterium sp. 50QC2O2 TaxID=2968459 RepID=UPI00211C66F6|nr:amidohydrolase family protein [Brevibacterium sp. 50QC2O2]MCQ9387193.1 amidohydrolase [Brevibacterium sp. 50QC2O2]
MADSSNTRNNEEHKPEGASADPESPPISDADIPAWLHERGIPGIVDLHVHFMPERVQAKVWDFFDHVSEHDPGAPPWPIAYRHPAQQRVQILRDMGVTAYTTLNYAHRPGMADWLNDFSTEFAAAHPDAIHSGTFYPEPPGATRPDPTRPGGKAPVSARASVASALEAGAQVFKVHVQVGDFDPADPLLDEAWDLLQQTATPVVIHCGNGPHAGRFTGAEPIRRLLVRFPELVLVIAHAGLPDYLEFARLAAEHPHVYLDTTMVGTDYMNALAPLPADYPRVLAGLAGRVVLGSDFPTIPYPYSHQLQALQRLGLGADWLRGVLWTTPRSLLGLD